MLSQSRALRRIAGKTLGQNLLPQMTPIYFGAFAMTNRRSFSKAEIKVENSKAFDQELLSNFPKLEQLSVKGRLVKPAYERQVGIWLLIVAGAVFCMVVLGGYTRLSKSGLSMTRWKPIQSRQYPESEEAWMTEFEHYKVRRSLSSNSRSTNWQAQRSISTDSREFSLLNMLTEYQEMLLV